MPNQVIWKYPLHQPNSSIVHKIPADAEVVSVAFQYWEPMMGQMWVKLDPGAKEVVERAFALIPTGLPFPAQIVHHGTIHDDHTKTVWHLIEEKRNGEA